MAQRAALTEAEKDYLRERKRNGVSMGQIAQELQCSRETIRKWWRLLKRGIVPAAHGRPKRGVLSTYPEAVREKVVALKKAHPHWGPISVQLDLRHDAEWNAVLLPSKARLSVLFRQMCPEAVQPRQQRITRPPKPVSAHAPHQRWQMDAKEQVRVGNEWVTIQEIRDLYSGIMLAAVAFVTTTEKWWRRLTLAEHQHVLRLAFTEWGLPMQVQTDNDNVFTLHNDPLFPSRFTLWLVGLGITHLTSRPHRPTDQAAIERNHRTLADFSWKDQSFQQLAPLQQALDAHRQRHNQEYPSQAAHCDGNPPLTAFPAARTTGRSYHPAFEWESFRMDLVELYLAQFVWTRPVMATGVVNLGGQHYSVGRSYRNQQVSIRFDPDTHALCFFSQHGEILKRLPPVGISKADLLGLLPADIVFPAVFQLPLPLEGV